MKRSDLTGKRSGRLMVIGSAGSTSAGRSLWLCRCDCGNTKELPSDKFGRTLSCGCLAKDVTVARSKTHGATGTKTFKVWSQMRRRCRDREEYADVNICARWESFENFLADMGECPAGMSLDRIDTIGDYEPDNCRWATPKRQANNRRNNFLITHAGRTMTAAEWADETGLQAQTIRWRINRGWPASEALR